MCFSKDVLQCLKKNGWNNEKRNIDQIIKYIKQNGYEVNENLILFLERFDKFTFKFPLKKSRDKVFFVFFKMIAEDKEVALDYEESVGEQLIPIGEIGFYYLIMISLSGKIYASFDGYLFLFGNNIYEMIENCYYGNKVEEIPIKAKPCTFKNEIYKINKDEINKYKEKFNHSFVIELDGKKCSNLKNFILELNKLIPFDKVSFDFQMHILNMRKLPEYINKESYLMIITNYNYFLTNDVINKELFENKYKSEVLSWYDNLIAVKLWGGEYKQFNILLVSD